ncbi:MAG TPA: DUF3892 domain-containing protein [Candidatus Limnocylindrales bacterium]|nr:DUF3892 domain-containing protein [Candidatus Limnocylindrales bacterium]
MPTVTHVYKELSESRTHEHIKGVCTTDGGRHSRVVVAASITSGVRWTTRSASGHEAQIRVIRFCPAAGCVATPYLTTRADDYRDDNLESLPLCG